MNHIEHSERRSIERYLKKKRGVRWIARALARSPSSISDEIRLGVVKGIYRADQAETKAKKRRRDAKQKCLKVAMDPKLKAYVTEKLKDDQSPEGIAGRIKHIDTHVPYASTKAIYAFIRSSHGGPLEHHFYRKRVKRKGGPKRGTKPVGDATKISIEKELSLLVDAVVYFTHPYTSSDKGTVENRNGRMREFVPKGCDISTIPQRVIAQVEQRLRTRFMKCLGFRTPQECWDAACMVHCIEIKKSTMRVAARSY